MGTRGHQGAGCVRGLRPYGVPLPPFRPASPGNAPTKALGCCGPSVTPPAVRLVKPCRVFVSLCPLCCIVFANKRIEQIHREALCTFFGPSRPWRPAWRRRSRSPRARRPRDTTRAHGLSVTRRAGRRAACVSTSTWLTTVAREDSLDPGVGRLGGSWVGRRPLRARLPQEDVRAPGAAAPPRPWALGHQASQWWPRTAPQSDSIPTRE